MTRAIPNTPDRVAVARAHRADIRAGRHDRVTTGMAPGVVQANICIVPADWAAEFLRFCQVNPKPCPLIGMTEPGDPRFPMLGDDIDIRSDVPRYRVFRDGVEVEEETDIKHLWRDDLVAFAMGCSYSFEEALQDAGLRVRHLDNGTKTTVYVTDIACTPAGRFRGPLVVSMRPFMPKDAIRAVQVTSRFPSVHGAPVHFGDPTQIGIADFDKPYSGPKPDMRAGEVPVFWACGVTPQLVVEHARPPLCITHKPGHMLLTDRLNAEFSVL
ncbi:MAG: putative hydro-lyase [Alphaproteobacteria bacterium]|nr:putative hydro-lyase [Alphaproteobacteria bacterium]